MTDREKVESALISAGIFNYCTNKELSEIACYLVANCVTVNEWRPASEPPKEDGAYLVSLTSFSGKHTWQDVCKFANNLEKVDNFDFKGIKRAGWYGYKDGEYYEIDDITHWMPLPEPPKGVDNGKID